MARIIKKENTTKRTILRLLSAPARYIKRKLGSIYKKLTKKEPKKTDKSVNKSVDESKVIAERNYMENLNNNNTNVDNNSNIIVDHDKITTIRNILNKLGNIITKKDKKKIKKELIKK